MHPSEPTVDATEEHYEPPPHALAHLWSGLVWLYRRMFREPTRWRLVWFVFVGALTYVFLQPIFRFLPGRFDADPRPILWVYMHLLRTAYADSQEFMRWGLYYGSEIVLFGSLREEIVFRGLPILLARFAQRRLGPRAGRAAVFAIVAVSTLLFAWMHNRVLGAMPVSHALFGAIAWGLAWRWGLRYSVLFHVFTNGIIFAHLMQRIMMIAG